MLKEFAQESESKDARLALALRVAELYYMRKASQSSIAQELGCSVATVSRLLKTAEEEGIIQVRVINPFSRASQLEAGMVDKYGLLECRVVNAPKSSSVGRKVLGVTGAELVADLMRDGDLVGLSWGTTMRELVNSLPSYGRPVNATVIPLIGGLGQVAPEHQVNILVHEFASCFNCDFKMMHAPALSDREETVKLLMEELTIRQVVDMWDQLTLAVVGIGESPRTSPMRRTGYYSEEEIAELMDDGAVGDISGRFFDSEGIEVDASANRRLLAISADTLRKVPRRMGVASGAEKVKAIAGALRGGWINILVTDSHTASALLQV
ncbi:MAG: sugar-binding transcriptional regulator [Bacillota bacterium]|nr:sugar-binding transcriptional regulator [Bacillota bacterium]